MSDSSERTERDDLLFAERFRAISARDVRFDGQFFTAVSSTGIYCRPSCPARTPKKENVTFYLTSAAAQEAGYRACKRCLPEAAAGTPEWNLRRDVAARAMRLILDGVVDRDGVDGLAARLGFTPRHVTRLLTDELGAGPQALARAHRAQMARSLLVGTRLPLADVAFASGFGSVRQFNHTVQEVFATRPSEIRATSRIVLPDRPRLDATLGPQGAGPCGTTAETMPVSLSLSLPVRQPFDAPGVFRFLAVRAVDGVETADVSDDRRLRYARTLTLPHGPGAAEITATSPHGSQWEITARLELSSLTDVATAVTRIRRLLDLDADPTAVDTALIADPTLAASVTTTPGIRVPGAVDPHEMVVRAIIGQQISVAAARTHLSRLARALGSPYPSSSFDGLSIMFATPEQIASGVPTPSPGAAAEPPDPNRPLRLPARSVQTVVTTARALADGELHVDVGVDPQTLRDALVARPGIGPWTAAYISMRVLGDPDAWMDKDVALVAGAVAAGLLDPAMTKPTAHRVLADHARRWAPWRSYAAMHLWRGAL